MNNIFRTLCFAGICAILAVRDGAASGFPRDPAWAWRESSVVVMGPVDWESSDASPSLPVAELCVQVEKAYKGAEVGDTLHFRDYLFRTTAGSGVFPGQRNVLFLQSAANRENSSWTLPEAVGTTVLLAYSTDDEMAAVDSAIFQIQYVPSMPPLDRKLCVLDHLPLRNPYTQQLLEEYAQRYDIVETIPYFERRMNEVSRDPLKIRYALTLRGLGVESMNEQLLRWLDDGSFTARPREYYGSCTEDERRIIKALVNDSDESVALTAKLIVERWKGDDSP